MMFSIPLDTEIPPREGQNDQPRAKRIPRSLRDIIRGEVTDALQAKLPTTQEAVQR